MKPKEQKQAEAKQRNEYWQLKTPQQQLDYLNQNNFGAKRQRARLEEAQNVVRNA